MTDRRDPTNGPGVRRRGLPPVLELAGCRYWTASLLPALVGTTLPFWLRPPGFSFRWLPAVEFLAGTILIHAGFSFFHALARGERAGGWRRSRLLGTASLCIAAGCLLGAHLNRGLSLHRGVPGFIFPVYGSLTLATGALYVAPPIGFWRRMFGEVVLCEGLGLLPVLGAYLVQVGDITRTVYLAALPLVVATGIWVWMDELVTRAADEKEGRNTLVIHLTARVSGRLVAPMLLVLLYATLLGAVFVRAIPFWALGALLSSGLAWRMVALSWRAYDDPGPMSEARRRAHALHLATGAIIAASSLPPLVT